MKNKIIIITAMLLIGSGAYSATLNNRSAGAATTDSMTLNVGPDTYRRQVSAAILFHIGESNIDPDYEGNIERLNMFVTALRKVLADPNYVVSRIVVVGTASPDGMEQRNITLAGKRAEALSKYLQLHTTIPADKIEEVNGGVNWTGLRTMIEASKDMPHRDAMLKLMDIPNPETRKYKMMFYADSEPWIWMFNNLFDSLRMGSGGTQGRAPQSILSRENWSHMRDIVTNWSLSEQNRQVLLHVIDTETNLHRRMQRIQVLCPDQTTYQQMQKALIAGVLTQASVLSRDNWVLLRERIAVSDITNKEAILNVIDSTSIINGREQRLRALDAGEAYRQILDRFFPELLVAASDSRETTSDTQNDSNMATLGQENWNRLRAMIAASDMPDREQVLKLIDSEPNPAVCIQKLRTMNNGATYNFINEVFFSELLYSLSPAAQENWTMLTDMVAGSDLSHKNQILEIIRTTTPGLERDEALRALDGGESFRLMGEMLLPKLLVDTELVSLSGSGMSFSYELSPTAKNRAISFTQKQQAAEQAQALAAQQAPAESPSTTLNETPKLYVPFIALKTDLMLWGGVMPDFKIGSWTPNLSVEIYFARRWSVQIGGAYSNWNTLSGSKNLYALGIADLEVRYWFGNQRVFKGFYLGVYGQYGQYDVQEIMQGQTGLFWSAGLGAGWIQPLSRHWALEGEIRGGYRSAQNEIYDIDLGHTYYNDKKTNGKFMPQFRLQVVYRFGKTQK